VYALNLTHSPENIEFWEWADPFIAGAGDTGGAILTSTDRHPGVSDSIELHNGRRATGRAASKGSWGNAQGKYPSTATNVKRGVRMAASRVMETGTPQWLAMKRGNARRAKVSTSSRPQGRTTDAMQGAGKQ
jgi:hypothetical protein